MEVTSTKSAAVAAVGKEELVGAFRSFVERAYDAVVTFHPAMAGNETVAKLSAPWSTTPGVVR